jgi:hypothetical protein
MFGVHRPCVDEAAAPCGLSGCVDERLDAVASVDESDGERLEREALPDIDTTRSP